MTLRKIFYYLLFAFLMPLEILSAQSASGVLPIVLKTGANKLLGPHGTTLALVDFEHLKSTTMFIKYDISPVTKRGLSGYQSELAYFSDTQGKKIICLNMESGDYSLITPPADGYLIWPAQPNPQCFLFKSATSALRTNSGLSAIWIFHPGYNKFSMLSLHEGIPKNGAIILDENHAVIATESNYKTSLWYLGIDGETNLLFETMNKSYNFTVLGEFAGNIALGAYTITEQGMTKESWIILVDLEGQVLKSSEKVDGGFRLSRLIEEEGKTFAIASSSLSNEGIMQNKVFTMDLTSLKLTEFMNFNFWYTENIYMRQGKIFLFNSLVTDSSEGFIIDTLTRSSTRFQF